MVATFAAASAIVLLTLALVFKISSGIRGFIGGEGLWSKGQKDAVYFITSYLHTRKESDYRNFLGAIAKPLGDHAARVEMEKPVFDAAVVTAGFMQGGIPAEDVPDMIFLFRHFQEVSYLAHAINVWKGADAYIVQLQEVSAALHRDIAARTLTEEQQERYAARLQEINTGVTPLEQQFSEILGEGSRALHKALFGLMLLITLLVLGLGIWVAWFTASELRGRVAALQEGAERVAAGHLGHRMEVHSSDELGALATAFNDMLQRRQAAESELKSANDFNDVVMRNASNAIYAMDTEGRFTMANRRTCEITGYTEAEILGAPYSAMLPENERSKIDQLYRDLIAGKGNIVNYETPVLRKDGRPCIVSFSTTALARDGVIFGAVGAAEDITERKATEVQLKARAEELARSNRELEQFAYVASHDLQEPLRTVAGFAQILDKRYGDRLDGEAQEYLRFVTDGAKRMKSLIEDLLAYARVAREGEQKRSANLEDAIATALANLQGAIQGADATITHDPLPTIPGDQRQMAQLFQNLMGNAIKFRGSKPPVIHVACRREGEHWKLEVCDNGIGIAPESEERIFGLFQRLHTLDQYPGNGIGLTICKKIVDFHGGRIWVKAGNPGTVFHFTLKA